MTAPAATAAGTAAPALTLLPGGALGAALTLIQRQIASRAQIADRTWNLVRAVFARVTDPRDPDVIDTVSAEVLRLVQGGQSATAQSTAAYVRGVLDQIGSRTQPVPSGAVVLDPSLRGLDDPASAYHRAFVQWRYARSIGESETDARAAGEDRLERQVDADLGMAMRSAVRDVLAGTDEAIGYRRILHPELSRGGACGLCIVAADRMYRKAELLPMHTHCRCTISPVTRQYDPGRELNDIDLDRVYGLAGSNRREDLKRVRIQVVDHGELGPLLAAA